MGMVEVGRHVSLVGRIRWLMHGGSRLCLVLSKAPLSAVRSLSAFAPNSFSLLSSSGANVEFLGPTGIEVAAGARRGRLGSSKLERRSSFVVGR